MCILTVRFSPGGPTVGFPCIREGGGPAMCFLFWGSVVGMGDLGVSKNRRKTPKIDGL